MIPLLIMFLCLLFVKPLETRYFNLIIPPQKVTRDQDITWEGKIPTLQGFFHVTINMFCKNQTPEGKMKLLISRGEKKITYTADQEWMTSSLLSFKILKDIRLYSGDHLQIPYDGNDSFFISDLPKSYMILDERDYPMNEANKTKKKTLHDLANKQTACFFKLIIALLVEMIIEYVL